MGFKCVILIIFYPYSGILRIEYLKGHRFSAMWIVCQYARSVECSRTIGIIHCPGTYAFNYERLIALETVSHRDWCTLWSRSDICKRTPDQLNASAVKCSTEVADSWQV